MPISNSLTFSSQKFRIQETWRRRNIIPKRHRSVIGTVNAFPFQWRPLPFFAQSQVGRTSLEIRWQTIGIARCRFIGGCSGCCIALKFIRQSFAFVLIAQRVAIEFIFRCRMGTHHILALQILCTLTHFGRIARLRVVVVVD